MQTRKLTEVPQSEFSKETNFIVEVDEELKRVPSSDVRKLVEDETDRAETAEKKLGDDLAAESVRAAIAENTNADNIAAETTRAKAAEQSNAENLAEEVTRAEDAEKDNRDDLLAETTRAKAEEGKLAAGLTEETARAEAAEKILTDNLADEITRAKDAEKKLTDDLAEAAGRAEKAENKIASDLIAETERAKEAEKTNADNLSAEISRAQASEDDIRSTFNTNKPVWDDKYTRNEVDNKFSVLETAIDWKEAVDTLADLSTAYPDPDDGWTVNVKDTDYTYRWSGTKWVAISANAIPKATQEVDGLLSKEDKADYDDAYSKRHTHSNKSVIDKITQALLDNWNAAYTHISDAVKHITAAERTAWNTVSNKVDKVSGKQLSTNDYTTAEKNKLAGIAPWAEATNKPAYNWTEITNKPSTFAPAAHTHTKSQVTDMPTKLSQFTNDSGFVKQTDIDTSQNHTHTNKTVLDKITQTLLDTWSGKASTTVATQTANGLMAAVDKKKVDGIASGANNYTHPATAGNKHIPSGGGSGQILRWSADGTAAWGADNNTTYSAFKAATASAAGGTGLVPAPAAGAQAKYLRADGTWQTLPNTSYTHPNSGATAGTYRSVTVDAQGHVKAGTNPTTLAGYGITDAAKSTRRTLTLAAAGWNGTYPFTQTVSVSGITANDSVKIIGVHIPNGATQAQVKSWNKSAGLLMHNPGGVAAGSITFKAYKKPAVDFSIITEGA